MRKLIFIFLPIVLCVSLGFQLRDTTGKFDRQKLRDYYERRMRKIHHRHQTQCRQEAAAMARTQVDSVLSGTKMLVAIDSFLRLPRPVKPERPELVLDSNQLGTDPLFDLEKDQ